MVTFKGIKSGMLKLGHEIEKDVKWAGHELKKDIISAEKRIGASAKKTGKAIKRRAQEYEYDWVERHLLGQVSKDEVADRLSTNLYGRKFGSLSDDEKKEVLNYVKYRLEPKLDSMM